MNGAFKSGRRWACLGWEECEYSTSSRFNLQERIWAPNYMGPMSNTCLGEGTLYLFPYYHKSRPVVPSCLDVLISCLDNPLGVSINKAVVVALVVI